jgi:protein TonB
MNTFMTIMSLILLFVMSWLAGYAVCLIILSLTRWSTRFDLEERFPWRRARKINRTIASVVGLIVAAVVMYYSAPATIRSLRPAPPHEEVSLTVDVPPAVEVPPLDNVNQLIEKEKKKIKGPRRTDGGRESPRAIEWFDPIYPQEGIEQQIEGTVIIDCIVTKEGTVKSPRVLRGVGLESMDEAAVEALLKWKFKPGKQDGIIADMTMTLSMKFVLDDSQKRPKTLE